MRKDRLPIASPCTEDWDAMDGDERRRSCQKCDKEVVNLSELTDREVQRLFQRKRGQDLCVRYAFDDAGNLELRPSPVPPLIPAALLTRGREVMLGASLVASALTGCNPAGAVGEAAPARTAIREAAEKVAEKVAAKGTCTVSMEPVLPMEVRLHAAPCTPPAAAASAPLASVPIAEAPPPKPAPPPPPVPTPVSDPQPATEPCHKKNPKDEKDQKDQKTSKYPHKLMGKPVYHPPTRGKVID